MPHALIKHSKLIILWGLVVAVVVAGVSLLFPHYYSAETQVLIISRDRSGLDPFTQAKYAQSIGDNLAHVIQTGDFFGKVMEYNGNSFNKSRWLNVDLREQRKRWESDVKAEMVYGTSLLKLTAYSPTQADAATLSVAVTQTLISHGWEYIGGDVSIKSVNSPLASRWLTRPNIPLNAAVGFGVGALLAIIWVTRYKRHTFTS